MKSKKGRLQVMNKLTGKLRYPHLRTMERVRLLLMKKEVAVAREASAADIEQGNVDKINSQHPIN
jgi:hypothetical protein